MNNRIFDNIKDITFREIRAYISQIDPLSICRLESLSYENYPYMSLVPEEYDRYYVYGIGMIDGVHAPDLKNPLGEPFANVLEIMVSEKPKSVVVKEDSARSEEGEE